MRTTIETIQGNKYTIIWHSDAFRHVQGITENRDGTWFWQPMALGGFSLFVDGRYSATHEATALPALQKKQTIDNSWLLRLYTPYDFNIYLLGSWRAADGYDVPLKEPEKFIGIDSDEYDHHWITSVSTLVWDVEISHVTDKSGARVEIAIEGE